MFIVRLSRLKFKFRRCGSQFLLVVFWAYAAPGGKLHSDTSADLEATATLIALPFFLLPDVTLPLDAEPSVAGRLGTNWSIEPTWYAKNAYAKNTKSGIPITHRLSLSHSNFNWITTRVQYIPLLELAYLRLGPGLGAFYSVGDRIGYSSSLNLELGSLITLNLSVVSDWEWQHERSDVAVIIGVHVRPWYFWGSNR